MPRPADPHARKSVIAAARAAFVKKGIRGARIEDITAECGLSKGAFYLHFESKEALFRELVDAFMKEVEALTGDRNESLQKFFDEHGQLEARDFDRRTRRYEQLLALETQHDLRSLELMWSYRDVIHVLISGSAGTEFEGLVWKMVDLEVQRVAESFRQLQSTSACRADVPPELFGSLIVGTYLLVGKRMIHERQRPDLASWASSLHRLIAEGSSRKNDPALRRARPLAGSPRRPVFLAARTKRARLAAPMRRGK